LLARHTKDLAFDVTDLSLEAIDFDVARRITAQVGVREHLLGFVDPMEVNQRAKPRSFQ